QRVRAARAPEGSTSAPAAQCCLRGDPRKWSPLQNHSKAHFASSSVRELTYLGRMAFRSRLRLRRDAVLWGATAAIGVCAALSASCSGIIPELSDAQNQDGRPGGAEGSAAPEATLRRLTVAQFHNTVADLFNGRVQVTTELEEDTALYGFS